MCLGDFCLCGLCGDAGSWLISTQCAFNCVRHTKVLVTIDTTQTKKTNQKNTKNQHTPPRAALSLSSISPASPRHGWFLLFLSPPSPPLSLLLSPSLSLSPPLSLYQGPVHSPRTTLIHVHHVSLRLGLMLSAAWCERVPSLQEDGRHARDRAATRTSYGRHRRW